MTDKHTPGPWVFRKDEGWTILADGESIMGNEQYYPWCPWNEADWRLIAAAPEMLEALKLLMTAHGEQLDLAFQTAQEAISKATGAPWPDA